MKKVTLLFILAPTILSAQTYDPNDIVQRQREAAKQQLYRMGPDKMLDPNSGQFYNPQQRAAEEKRRQDAQKEYDEQNNRPRPPQPYYPGGFVPVYYNNQPDLSYQNQELMRQQQEIDRLKQNQRSQQQQINQNAQNQNQNLIDNTPNLPVGYTPRNNSNYYPTYIPVTVDVPKENPIIVADKAEISKLEKAILADRQNKRDTEPNMAKLREARKKLYKDIFAQKNGTLGSGESDNDNENNNNSQLEENKKPTTPTNSIKK